MNHDETNLSENKKPEMHTWIDLELEARVVAWVAGEASAFEAAELERLAAEKPELAIFKRRIEAMHSLAGEAARRDREPLRMAEERRAKLLATLRAADAATTPVKTEADAPAVFPVLDPKRPRRWRRNWSLVGSTAAAACVAIVTFLALEKNSLRSEFKLGPAYGSPGSDAPRDRFSVAVKNRVNETNARAKVEMPAAQMLNLPEVSAPTPDGVLAQGVQAPTLQVAPPMAVAKNPLAEKPATFDMAASTPASAIFQSLADTSSFGFTANLPGGVGDKELAPSGPVAFGGTLTLGGDVGQKKAHSLGIVATALAQKLGELQFLAGSVTLGQSGASQTPTRTAGEETVVLSPVTISADRNVESYAAGAHTAGTTTQANRASQISTAASAAANDTITLSAFTVSSPTIGGRREATNPTSKAPLPPPPVARARPAPKQQVASANEPVASTPVPASTAAITLMGSTEGDTSGGKLNPFIIALNTTNAVTLDPRKDVVNDEQKRANLEETKKRLQVASEKAKADAPATRPAPPPPPPVEETSAAKEPTSTFSLHVSDVSFRLAAAAFARGEVPDAARIRPEEFYNALDYGDPAPSPAEKISCRIEQSAHPFAQQRNLVRLAMKVGATGRGAGTPLRLTVLLDTSGSMEREDRRATVQRALAVLVSLLGPNDRITLIGFARSPRLLAEAVAGHEAGPLVDAATRTPADGGTNIEEALKLAGDLARRHRHSAAQNRIVLLTDGAANLGNAEPASLATAIAALRSQGIAFDACGVGLDGLDDDILESLTRSGDGRYYALNSPADADAGFAQKLAGAFRPAAENVKLQVRFNPARVGAYRLIGFEQHRLRAEDFRNDWVDAAELAAEEAAVALYQVEALPFGEGDLGEVFVRFRDPATGQMVERSWPMNYDARAPAAQIRLADLAPIVASLRARHAAVPRVQELATMYAQMRRVLRE